MPWTFAITNVLLWKPKKAVSGRIIVQNVSPFVCVINGMSPFQRMNGGKEPFPVCAQFGIAQRYRKAKNSWSCWCYLGNTNGMCWVIEQEIWSLYFFLWTELKGKGSTKSSHVKLFEGEWGGNISSKQYDKIFCRKYESLSFQLTNLITENKIKPELPGHPWGGRWVIFATGLCLKLYF